MPTLIHCFTKGPLPLASLSLLLSLSLFLPSCGDDDDFNIFSIQQDLELGQQTAAEIRSMPAEFPIIDEAANPAAYAYLQGMVDEIVRLGDVPHADVFPYGVAIIKNDETLNAFATPGGFLYVYTGLIKALETEDELAGVMAHEIAHSAERHSTDQLTQQYGVATLLTLLSGGDDPGLLSNIVTSLLELRFSRGDEEEADARSVDYLCNTEYAANGAAGFFEQIAGQGSGGTPEFLSTHPNPDNRVADINERAADKNCATDEEQTERFREFQNGL